MQWLLFLRAPLGLRRCWKVSGVIALLVGSFAASAQTRQDSVTIRRLYDEALLRGQSYENLRHLTTRIGGRLSGSPQAAQAVAWSKKTLENLGLDRVYLQEVLVPHWVRGAREKAFVRIGRANKQPLAVCALGGSIGTGGRLRAGVVEVNSWAQLAALPVLEVAGKIVFFNRALQPVHSETFQAYFEAVDQRNEGAVQAARRGAVGVLVRSLTLAHDNLPHTGAVRYEEQTPKIPAAAISTLGAEQLSHQLRLTPGLELELEMHCQTLPDVLSYNVVGEWRGQTYPEEIITVGGHLDSWDLGQGAHDDGAGTVQSIEVLRLLKATGLHPERTIRVVLFMNEENGNRGGLTYAELARQNSETHLAAIESDAGGFTPRGFRVEASPAVLTTFQRWRHLLRPYQSDKLSANQRGVDIGPLKTQVKALISYDPDDQRLFDVHHTAADTFDKVNRRELELGGASIAALVYLISRYGL
ncbi:peptidase M28 family protein [Hymenobacter crusticola]|uniref:Carboxypeptidase Q n=2 Tax=Hymenobacter crusticola TaxID=1770526 RepID=A0A243W746_9BACT|nr:peptidase M28 family protein [Hymenobacter crusticola]